MNREDSQKLIELLKKYLWIYKDSVIIDEVSESAHVIIDSLSWSVDEHP